MTHSSFRGPHSGRFGDAVLPGELHERSSRETLDGWWVSEGCREGYDGRKPRQRHPRSRLREPHEAELLVAEAQLADGDGAVENLPGVFVDRVEAHRLFREQAGDQDDVT